MEEVYLTGLLCLSFGIVFGAYTTYRYFQGKLGRMRSEMIKLYKVRESVEAVQRKSDEYFGKIEEVIAEREQWRSWYNYQAAGHDNAQAMMMRQISQLAQAYHKTTGKDYQLDPVIDKVRTEWHTEHGEEARTKKQEAMNGS